MKLKHGLYRENASLFNVWQTMKARCENANRDNYARYNVNDSALMMALDILWWMPLPELPKEEM